MAGQHLDLLHVGPMAAAEAMIKDNHTAGDDLVIAVEPAPHVVAQAGLEIKGLLPQAGEIGMGEITGKTGVIASV